MKYSKIAKDYYSKIDEIVNQLKSYEDNVPKPKVVGKILITCTKNMIQLLQIAEESKDIDKLTTTKLMGSLEAYKEKQKK